MHKRQDDDVYCFEYDAERRSDDGGGQPGRLLLAGDIDAADSLGECLSDWKEMTVACRRAGISDIGRSRKWARGILAIQCS